MGNGQLERLFRIPAMAVLAAATVGSLDPHDVSDYGACRSDHNAPAGVLNAPATHQSQAC